MKKHQWKLHRKLQREFKQKIGDITFYLIESLRDLNKAQKRWEKWNSHHPDELQKQHEDRKQFQQQAEVETAARHNESPKMTITDKATRLAQEQEATRIRDKEFEKR